MRKTLIGPRLRRLRREQKQTQAEMARSLGVSTAYVNLLENNQRSLSVQMLMALSDAYGVDWRDLIKDESSTLLADLRNAMQDPVFGDTPPDLQELRAAIDHAPGLELQSRLSCQAVPDGSKDVVIEIPGWNRNLVGEEH